MNNLVRHSFESLPIVNIDKTTKLVRDGDFDAVEAMFYIPEAEKDYIIFHGLGRPVTRVSIEFKSQPVDYGVVKNEKGEFLNDKEKIGLWFSEGQVTIRLRLA